MGNKYVVFGAGRMGRAVAWYLANQSNTDVVNIVDSNDSASAKLACEFLNAKLGHKVQKTMSSKAEHASIEDLKYRVHGSHVCIATCGYQSYVELTKACISEGVNMIDLGGNRDVVLEQKLLHDDAKKANVTIIPDCGLAPGLIGVLGMHVFQQVKKRVTTDIDISMRVGGLPANPGTIEENPLRYELTWSADGLINEYSTPADELRNGKLVQVAPLTDHENSVIKTPWEIDEFEAFTTGGGSSNLPEILKDQARNINYKTLRYRGHCKIIQGLARLGFFSNDRLVDGLTLTYKQALIKALNEKLTSKNDDDVVIARAGCRGTLSGDGKMTGAMCEIFCAKRSVFGQSFSAMAQTTGFSAGIIAKMIADNAIKTKGVCDGETAVPGKQFVENLQKVGITVKEINR